MLLYRKYVKLGNQSLQYLPTMSKTFFWVKYLNSLRRIRDPEWKKLGSGIRDKHRGSATLGSGMRNGAIVIKIFCLLERGWKEDLEMHELELRRLQEDSNKRFGELKRAYEQAERRTPLLSVR
jgi:hypothetical protein